MMLVIKK